jgi:hypothetical protein
VDDAFSREAPTDSLVASGEILDSEGDDAVCGGNEEENDVDTAGVFSSLFVNFASSLASN